MTKNQQKIMTALQENDWLSAKDLSAITGIVENHIRTALNTKVFLNIQKGIKDTGINSGNRYVKVYKYKKSRTSLSDEALELAKQHTGMFGQLHWAAQNDTKIVLVDEA